MLCPPNSQERLRWRTWPCPKCSGGISPISYLFRRIEAGAIVRSGSPESITISEVAELKAWVARCEHSSSVEISLPRLAEGSEHIVYFDESATDVYKTTRQNTFGEAYLLVEGIMHQKNCSPLDYLVRLRLWDCLFGSAPLPLGLSPDGLIVSSHKFITGTLPDQQEVNDFLRGFGMIAVREEYWPWKRSYDDFEVWLGDARCDNFVKTESAIVPIDVRVWFGDSI